MGNGNRRDSLSVLADLLDDMEEPRRITHLLYTSNLNYGRLTKYLKMLIIMGLADEQMKPHLFKITSEGKFFMNIINRRKKQNRELFNSTLIISSQSI